MPSIIQFENPEDKAQYLKSYARTYLKEEVQMEQLVRKLDPFREFLSLAAQGNGQILNFSKLSDQIGVDVKTVQNYCQILEDTLLGFFLPAFHRFIRKRQRLSPNFFSLILGSNGL